MNRPLISRVTIPLLVPTVISLLISTASAQDRYSKVRIPISSREDIMAVARLGIVLEGGLYGSRRWIDLLVNEREAISRAFPVPKMQAPDLSIGRYTFRTIHPLVSRAYFRRTSFFVSVKLCCTPVAVIRQKYVPPASLFASNR